MTGVKQNGDADSDSRSPGVPGGRRIYAIGDVHGRLDLLQDLLAAVEKDASAHPKKRKTLVFLGDYVDRGPDSSGVLGALAGGGPDGIEVEFLKGNHEDFLLRFVNDEDVFESWMMNGGGETLESYGIETSVGTSLMDIFRPSRGMESIRRKFQKALPRTHLEFLLRLKTDYTAGDYFFVHAGVRPGIPLDRQEENDLLWIRDSFLESDADLGKVVVHGHSISLDYRPEVRANRIGIDTGAYLSGRLTCLVLDGKDRNFLHT